MGNCFINTGNSRDKLGGYKGRIRDCESKRERNLKGEATSWSRHDWCFVGPSVLAVRRNQVGSEVNR